MKDIFGIPVIENTMLPNGTAFLIVQDKGVITQMVKVHDEIQAMSTADLIAELERRRPCKECKDYEQIVCGNCFWDSTGQDDNFKPKQGGK